ncbi:hypothetical protein OYC64_016390 [Pagothenia borchgrevinki]|uniref:E3 ubiquitin/ISG15 ligase TRIM25-like n=2 Tax=Pagothenia borchgrevinki TaxID=8213 RepID=A0ABD2HKC9_PAGBO
MSSVSCLLSEEQFQCSICLDLFRDPVSTPCGHNFCKTCITEHWKINYRCPLCNEGFKKIPLLRVNTLFSEMVGEFRQSAQQKANRKQSQQQSFTPVNVSCDFCTGTKLKALKSCLVCLASYCETHLEPHFNVSGLKRHQLIDPVENLEDRMCPKHDKPLELFCKTDQTFVCLHCSALDHKMHEFVPLKYECEDKKVELVKTEAKIQDMIQKRRVKIEAIRHSVKCSTENAHMELSEGVQVFTSLIKFLERGLNELYKTIGKKMTTTQKQAEGLIKELEQEISDLKKRNTDVGQVTRSEDHLHVLRSFPLLKAVPPTKDWTKINVHVSSYENTVEGALIQLEETLNKEMKKLLGEAELKRVQKYAVDVTLDPDTAHPELILSPDRKQPPPAEGFYDLRLKQRKKELQSKIDDIAKELQKAQDQWGAAAQQPQNILEFDDVETPDGQCTALYTFQDNSEGTTSLTEDELRSTMEEEIVYGWKRVQCKQDRKKKAAAAKQKP